MKIHRAGVVPFIEENNIIQMMFMMPTNADFGGERYQIAKGKQEDKETIKQTALREAKEELGLFEGNILHLEEIGVFLGRTTIFAAHIKDKQVFGDPDGYETASVRWLTLEEFSDTGRQLHIPIIQAVHRYAEKYLNND